MSNSEEHDSPEGIAVVGMAGRWPGARNVEEFWRNLRDGVESIIHFSQLELEEAGIDPGVLSNPQYVRAAGYLAGVDLFDAPFFGFNPREAEITDPQHRLFLECAWEALESAGYDAEKYDEAVGVYAGVGVNSYLMNLYSNRDFMSALDGFQLVIGNDKDHLSTRVSYKLNLRGPAVTVGTSCSTSLVAINLACQSLQSYQCDMALAGGVRVVVPQKAGYFYREGGIASPDGHCRAFDAAAQGVVAGSGAAIVVLKRLADAIADGDQVLAVIKGTSLNNDGFQKIGYTAPSVQGQAEVIMMAQALAGVDAETITYVEAHGTATPLGDPIEVKALTQAFRASTQRKNFCAIGSVKTNVGHLDAAAGVTGLIKTVLALKNRQIPPSLHFERPNPGIDFADSPFYVNAKLSEWAAGSTPRRAGVSSFGIGGTNAHVVLEEAGERHESGESREYQVLVLSAKTESALDAATVNLTSHLKAHPDIKLADVAYTLQVGRRDFAHKRMVVCRDAAEAVEALETPNHKRVFSAHTEPGRRPVVFMFPGQGAQHVRMGSELYAAEPIFRWEVDRCAEFLTPHLGFDLREVINPREEDFEKARERLTQTGTTQPAVFVVSYALAKLWTEWGVRPDAMIGHSVGEYVAACLAGVFSLEDALALIAARGRLMQELPGGAMLSVGGLSEEDAHRLRSKEIAIAAVNGPGNYVLSGPVEAVDALEQELCTRGFGCRRLHTSHAFHSEMMEPILERFTERVKRVTLHPPHMPYISNVTGTWMQPSEATKPGYWAKHLRQTVLFAEGLQELFKEGERILLEVGPGQTLCSLALQHPERPRSQLVLSSLGRIGSSQPEEMSVLTTYGKLWMAGADVDWKRFSALERRHRVSLPTYPFERQRYWIEKQQPGIDAGMLDHEDPLGKKPDVADWFYLPAWKRTAPPHLARPVEKGGVGSGWLIFADECGLGARLAERLKEQGHDVVSVRRGERFQRLGEDQYAIDPSERAHYEDLFVELRAQGRAWQTIAHLWGVTPGEVEGDGAGALDDSQEAGFYSLVQLMQSVGEQVIAQALQESSLPESFRVEVVTNDMQAVTGDESLRPEKATVLGPCKVIPQEYPNVSCRSIDITLPPRGETWRAEKLVEQLLAELSTEHEETVVAYRGNHRWVQTYEAVRPPTPEAEDLPLRERGTYLITGGMGGIGLVLAEHFANLLQARLVLVGRSKFPGRDEWAAWLESHDEQDAVGRKIRKLLALEAAGAEVLVCSADVSDEGEMREVVGAARKRFGRVHGVIHAAGNPPSGLIQTKTREAAASVLAPKVRGTLVLDSLLKDEGLDFFLLYSSLSSILGFPGRADYAAANAFLDAFAQHKSAAQGTPTVSVNWDGWQEVGMGINYAQAQNLNPDDIEEGMLSREALAALTTILGSRLPQVVVSVQDFEARAARNRVSSASKLLEQLTKKGLPEPNHPRPNLGTPYVAPRNQVEQTIADIWQHLLGIEQVGINDSFFELGGDSVISIQFIARANKAGLRLTPKQVFEFQTVAELAGAAGTTEVMQAEQGIVTGPVPLTPIQRRFFEQHTADEHHFNQSFMFEVREALQPSLVERTLQYLLGHHDALRLSFTRGEGGWEQFNAGFDGATPFTCVDLSNLPGERQTAALEAAAAATQTGLDLKAGPLVRLVLFDLGAGVPMRLLIVVHHLAIDGVSWRMLLEDMQTIFGQLAAGQPIDIGLKTTSFKAWAERLAGYATSIESERDYWLDPRRELVTGLPVDYPESLNTEASARSVTVSLTAEETQALLQEVPQAFHTQINEVLMTALVQSCASWTGVRSMVVDMEGHGREAIFEDVDLSRTVGWFTTVFPVLLDIEEAATPLDALRLVKESLRGVPNRGLGYGVTRYLSPDAEVRERLGRLPQSEIVFLYLGQLDQSLADASTFSPARESVGATANPLAPRSHLLEVSGSVYGGQLKMGWRYSENLHRRSTVERLAEGFVSALRALIALSRSAETVTYMPADFADAGLSQEELDELIAELTASEGQS